MKKNTGININLGISSILLIFFVLSMVSFAVLSLSSSLSDKKLTDKTVAKNIAYYDACNKMQFELAALDERYLTNYQSVSSEQEYVDACSGDTLLTVSASDSQLLEVIVEPTYPGDDTDHLYKIISWRLINAEEPKIDFTIPIVK